MLELTKVEGRKNSAHRVDGGAQIEMVTVDMQDILSL